MLSWQDIVQNYISKYSDKIRKTTQPLREHFGIGYFTHHRIDSMGNYTVLVDRPDWAEHYVETKVYLEDPFLGLPECFESGICGIKSSTPEPYMDSFKNRLSMDTGVMLIQKHEADVEFFGFFGNEKTCSLTALSLNHPQLFYSFAAHFTHEFTGVLSHMRQQKASLAALKGKKALSCKPVYPELDTTTLAAFYSDLGYTNEVAMVQKLSKRERQCLKLLLEGKSAKETASILGPTRRTIESYFENIKAKLSCWSKQELFSAAKRLQDIGLLP